MRDDIVGHVLQRHRLRRLFMEQRMPSGLMLSGPAGVGKYLIARELAQSLFCAEIPSAAVDKFGGCRKCHACRLFESGNLPDLHTVDCSDRDQANVESFRSLLYSLNLSAFDGGARLVLINNAEDLSVQCANVLLKALEEPRKDTHFIIVSANHAKLPDTVLSRCQIWFFDVLTTEEVLDVIKLRKNELPELPPDATVGDLALLADGSPGNLENVIRHYSSWQDLCAQIKKAASGDLSAALSLARTLAADRENLRARLHLLRIEVRRRMHSDPFPKPWSELLLNLLETERLVFERNINPAYALNAALSSFVEASGRTNILPETPLLAEVVV